MTLVSVIIPTFNRADRIAGAIDSVLTQTHRDVEVIVIDDGSTDATAEIVGGRYGEDPRVHLHRRRNAGVAAARNTGLDRARGDVVAFLDSDDTWQPWHLELVLASLERFPEAGLVWTDIEAVDSDGDTVAESYLSTLLSAYDRVRRSDLFPVSVALASLGVDIPGRFLDRRLYVGEVFSAMVLGNLVLTSSSAIRRERLERVGRFDEQLRAGEDYEFFLRVAREGPVAFADIDDTRYRVGSDDQLTGPAMALPMAEGYLRVLERTLTSDADPITLSPSAIAGARAYAYAWLGEQHLNAGSRRLARAYLATATRIRFQPRTVAVLFLTFLPSALTRRLVGALRSLRSRGVAGGHRARVGSPTSVGAPTSRGPESR